MIRKVNFCPNSLCGPMGLSQSSLRILKESSKIIYLKKKKKEAIRVIINLCCCPELPMNHQGNEKLNIYGPFQNWKMRKDGRTSRHVFHHSSTRLGKDLQRNEEKAEVIWKWVARTPSLKGIVRVALEWVARRRKIYIEKDEVLQRK